MAAWIEYAYAGYPFTAPPDAVARARANKGRVLERGMIPGFRIAGIEGGTTGTEALSAEEGVERFGRAWRRLIQDCPAGEHAFFGPMTHEEWVQLNLRHAELHLGFVDPGQS